MHSIETINRIIALLFAICYFYQYIYVLVPYFKKYRIVPKNSGNAGKATIADADLNRKQNRFAAVICARNEEKTLENCIRTLLAQDYPGGIRVFVAADNCTDKTAEIARHAGAIVYERNDLTKIGKGYALNFIFKHIEKDYPNAFDAFFIFDADNLVDEHYTAEMNKMLNAGYDVATCFRNSKNYDDSWISAGSGLWYVRESRYLNESRYLLGSGCAVSGTGFMVSSEYLKKIGGWNYFLLIEDIEFTVCCAVAGEHIGYCKNAVIYDEQPATMKASWKQRLRWSKGYLQLIQAHGGDLFKGIFRGIFKKGDFTCFDIGMNIFPAYLLGIVAQIVNIVGIIVSVCIGSGITTVLLSILQILFNSYIIAFVVGLIATIDMWKIIPAKTAKKIIYIFTFPIYMMTYLPISVAAIFSKASWVPTVHECTRSLDDLRGKSEKSETETLEKRERTHTLKKAVNGNEAGIED